MDTDIVGTALEVIGEVDLSYVADARPVAATESRWFPYLGSGEGRVDGPALRGRARFSSFESELNGASANTCIEDKTAACALNVVLTIGTEDDACVRVEANGYA